VIHFWASIGIQGKFRDVDFAWTHVLPRGFDYHVIPGDHESMLHNPRLAEILAAELDRATSPTAVYPESAVFRPSTAFAAPE